MKLFLFVTFLGLSNIVLFSQENVSIMTTQIDSTKNDTISVETTQNEVSPKKSISKDSSVNWQTVDSMRYFDRNFFYSRVSQKEEKQDSISLLNVKKTNHNYYYFLFLLFVIGVILFSRFFPYQFKLQYMAFFHRASQSELLSTENDWLEAEKIFPFVISLLFYSTWIVGPLLSLFANEEYSYAVIILGCIVFALIFLVLRILQVILSYPLDFSEIMQKFTRTSFNSTFAISLIGFPVIIILISVLKVNIFENPSNSLLIIAIIYIVRTLKSLTNCLRYEQRQIIYLIIYLCTLEIPLLLIGFKWISDNTQI